MDSAEGGGGSSASPLVNVPVQRHRLAARCSVTLAAGKSFPGVHCSGVPVIRLLLIVQFFTSNNVTCLALIEMLRF